jgi:hypothetical protein
LLHRLPRTDDDRIAMLEQGQTMVSQMGWDQVLSAKPLPMLRRVFSEGRSNTARAAAVTSAG